MPVETKELVTKLSFKIDSAQIEKFEKIISNAKNSLNELASAAAKSVAGVTVFASGLTALAVSFSKSTIANDALAEKLGVNSSTLQELALASQSAGASVGELEKSFSVFNTQLAKNNKGVVIASEDFKKLGISIKDQTGAIKDTATLYNEAAISLDSITDRTEKAAISQRLFGNSSKELTDFMSQSSIAIAAQRAEVAKLGYVVDSQGIKSAKEFIKTWGTFKVIIDGVRKEISARFLPVINNILTKFKDWYLLNRDFISQGISQVIENIGSSINTVFSAINLLTKPLRAVIDFFGGFGNAIRVVGTALAVSMIPRILAAISAFKEFGVALVTTPAGRMIALLAGIGLAIGLLVDDIYHWQKGNDSAIGRMLGTYEDFKSKVKSVIDSVKEKFDKFVGYLGGAENASKTFAVILTATLLPAVISVANTIVTSLIPAIASTIARFAALTATMLANPFVLVTTLIAGVGFALYKLLGDSEKFKEGFKNAMKIVGEAAAAFFDTFVDSVKFVSDAVNSLLEKLNFKKKTQEIDIQTNEIKDISVKESKINDESFEEPLPFKTINQKVAEEAKEIRKKIVPIDESNLKDDDLAYDINKKVSAINNPSIENLRQERQASYPTSLEYDPGRELANNTTNNRSITNNNNLSATINITAPAGTSPQDLDQISKRLREEVISVMSDQINIASDSIETR